MYKKQIAVNRELPWITCCSHRECEPQCILLWEYTKCLLDTIKTTKMVLKIVMPQVAVYLKDNDF